MKDLISELSTREFLRVVADVHVQFHWSQSGEDVVLHRLVGDRTEGFYVDVGAHNPRLFSNTYFLHRFRGWRGINVDATSEKVALFDAQRPDDVNLCLLVGDEAAGEVEFAVRDDSGLRNAVVRGERAERLRMAAAEIRRMPAVPLRAVLDEHLPEGQSIDLLNVDCEGLDLEVLRSNDWSRYRPAIVCVEDFAIRRQVPSRVAEFLMANGYHSVSHCYDTSIYAPRRDTDPVSELDTGQP